MIDADALKEYCKEGLIDVLLRFKTDKYKDLAIQVTGDFCRDIDEQPTVQAVPIEVLDKIRAEIDSHCSDNRDRNDGLYIAMKIIDKYRTESEEV